jgi:hypothetical protein
MPANFGWTIPSLARHWRFAARRPFERCPARVRCGHDIAPPHHPHRRLARHGPRHGRTTAAGHDLLCISRKTNDALAGLASRAGVACEQWAHDLARPESAAAKLETWLSGRDAARLASVTLINNAGLLPPIAPLAGVPARDARA